MEISIKLKNDEEIRLKSLHFSDKPEEVNIYRLVSLSGGKVYLKLELRDNSFFILEKDREVAEDDDLLKNKLNELLVELNPNEQIGAEDNETKDAVDETPYDPEKIRVDTKSFSLRQIYDMIKAGDIDLAPDFQRHLVWDNLRKSRLIESILLRIPLPMFYFAQGDDGKISVVDGLQRLSSIREFMDNEFWLKDLEYLDGKCGGKYYNLESEDSIDAKYFRWFNMTQITVNVIDPSSPINLKYAIFLRINTGGKPLNSQEIRNCLSSNHLRKILKEMANLASFQEATGWSIKDVRMEAQELALRFILFHRKYKADSKLNNYTGNIESDLNILTDELSKDKKLNLTDYITLFDNAMLNAYHLFDRYSFRKCSVADIDPNAYRRLINKALFVSWSVLLSQYPHDKIVQMNEEEVLALPLATKVSEDSQLFLYLSYSTNSKVNIQAAFQAAEEIIENNLKF